MCARYTLTTDPKTLGERFGVAPAPGLKPRYNLAPGQEAAAVIAAPEPRMSLLRWGLLPSWAKGPTAKPQINARAETLADKPFFRESFRWRRALIPADGWFEWQKRGADKGPRLFRLKSRAPFAFAGLWESGTFALVTVPPNPLAARVHDRMPALLPPDAEREWLDLKTPPARLRELLLPYPAELMDATRVSDRVGSVAADDPSLLAPAERAQGDLFDAL